MNNRYFVLEKNMQSQQLTNFSSFVSSADIKLQKNNKNPKRIRLE